MQSRTLFVTLFIVMCLMFAMFAAEESVQNEDMLSLNYQTTDEQIAKWKEYLSTISAAERQTLFTRLKSLYAKLPEEVQDKIAQATADFMVSHNMQVTDEDSDEFSLQEDPNQEFICGGLCVGGAILAISAISAGGYKLGAHQGKKADPIVHKHYHDDDFDALPWAKFLGAFKFSRDAAQTVLTDPNPGKHTHVYHYDDDETELNVPALKEWIAKWRAMTPEEKEREKAIFKAMWNNMSSWMQDYYKSQMRAALQAQAANPEEDAFVCGGICIGIGLAVAGGVFVGSKNAGKDNNQRHEHHHYKK